MAKQLIFNSEARSKVRAGIDKLADAVKTTLGPKGRNVILDKEYGAPQIVNDGVTIAKDILLEDKFENMGAKLIKEVAVKTNDEAGDGTTTATVLAQAIVKEGIQMIESGSNPVYLRKGIEKGVAIAVEFIETIAKPITTKESKKQVATISSGDEEIGTIIADVLEEVGDNGVVTVGEGKSFGLDKEIVSGVQFNTGYVSPYMITSQDKGEADYSNIPILVTDYKLDVLQENVSILEKVHSSGSKNLVIVADDIDGDFLTTVIINKLKGAMDVLCIKAPYFGDRKREFLKDLAAVTGAKFVSSEVGLKIKDLEVSDLGFADRVVSTKELTKIIGGKANKEEVDARVAQINLELDKVDSKHDIDFLKERLAKLTGGVAVIKVGANSEVEIKEKKLRIEDAINATKAAVEEGIVAGGGMALLYARKKILEHLATEGKNDDYNRGIKIVADALVYPFEIIFDNAGECGAGYRLMAEKDIRSLSEADLNLGFDASAENNKFEWINMFDRGIIDPAKVTKTALKNAASVSGMILTTSCAVTDIKTQGDGLPQM